MIRLQQSNALVQVLALLAQIDFCLITDEQFMSAIAKTNICCVGLIAIAYTHAVEHSTDHEGY